MKNRQPFELRRVLIVYNFLQVLFSIWLFNEASMTGWFTGYSFRCQPVDYSRSPTAMRVSAIYLSSCHSFVFAHQILRCNFFFFGFFVPSIDFTSDVVDYSHLNIFKRMIETDHTIAKFKKKRINKN